MSELLGKQCSCINDIAKQALSSALDYQIITVERELRAKEDLLKEAKAEFKPGEYPAEKEDQLVNQVVELKRLQEEAYIYLGLRKEVIELPSCDEPAPEDPWLEASRRSIARKELRTGRPWDPWGPEERAKRAEKVRADEVEMLAKDKLSMDSFAVPYEQLPDIRKMMVNLTYGLRLEKARGEEA